MLNLIIGKFTLVLNVTLQMNSVGTKMFHIVCMQDIDNKCEYNILLIPVYIFLLKNIKVSKLSGSSLLRRALKI